MSMYGTYTVRNTSKNLAGLIFGIKEYTLWHLEIGYQLNLSSKRYKNRVSCVLMDDMMTNCKFY